MRSTLEGASRWFVARLQRPRLTLFAARSAAALWTSSPDRRKIGLVQRPRRRSLFNERQEQARHQAAKRLTPVVR
jgi:hypothetical protein